MLGKILRRLLLLLLLIMLGLTGVGYYLYQQTLQTPLTIKDRNIIHVNKGSGINHIARELKDHHGLKNDWALILYTRLNGDAGKIQAGDYRIEANMTAPELLETMKTGKVIVLQFQLIEGKTVKDLLTQLATANNIQHTLQGKSEQEIAQQLGITGSLEGQFLPETYNYHYGTKDIELLKRMHQALTDLLNKEWAQRADNLAIKTPEEALILASLIEKETGVATERAQVSGVFQRRLKSNMRLQTDPSVIYGISNYNGNITRKDLQTDTPYNTYTRDGLPPTPIALAGRASIHAALHPDTSDTLYFVANGSGGHTFSTNYADHQKAVARYLEQQKHSK